MQKEVVAKTIRQHLSSNTCQACFNVLKQLSLKNIRKVFQPPSDLLNCNKTKIEGSRQASSTQKGSSLTFLLLLFPLTISPRSFSLLSKPVHGEKKALLL